MKKLVLGLFLIGFIAVGHSQIVLDEARVDYKIPSMSIDPVTQTLVLQIPEKKAGEFESDPLQFMKERFDIQKMVKDNEGSDYIEYHVTFVSNKGQLQARFKPDGDLVSSKQRFVNTTLPADVRLEIARLYQDAKIEKSKHFAHSKGWDIDKEYYKVKLVDGDKTKRLRIDRQNNQLSVAGL